MKTKLFLSIFLIFLLGCQTPPKIATQPKENVYYIVIWPDFEKIFEEEKELTKYLKYFKHRTDYKVEKIIVCGHSTIFEDYEKKD